jgi:hypothetical protein
MNYLSEQNIFSVGDIYLYGDHIENPYKRPECEIKWDERKAVFDYLLHNFELPDYVKEVWYAPSGGGAKKLDLITVKYQGSFITGIPV